MNTANKLAMRNIPNLRNQREDKNRWFISFGDSVLECEENEYKDYFSKKNHYDYTQKDKLGKKIVPILLEQYKYSDTAQAFFMTARLYRLTRRF